ncbi:hemolysin family protein [Rickettsiales bacterium LUAb2]
MGTSKLTKSFGKIKKVIKNIIPVNTKNINQDLDNKLKAIIQAKKNHNKGNSNPELYILNNIVNIKDEKVIDIITPRVDIVAVDKDVELDELIKIFNKSGFSRLPVYNETVDDIIGFIHVKDVINILRKGNSLVIESILRPVLFVSPYIKVLDLLFEMIAKRNYVAMVVDEFGGIDGLVTLEDIIEEIVGDINDEHDKLLKKLITVAKPGYLEADARLSLKELEEKIGNFLEEEEKEEVDTLGGLISYIAGRVPAKNEIIIHSSGVEFEILAGDPLKVSKIGVRYKNLHKVNDK